MRAASALHHAHVSVFGQTVLTTSHERRQRLQSIGNSRKTLCEAPVRDYVRAMATLTSWNAIAYGLNEMKRTHWTRSVSAPYVNHANYRRPATHDLYRILEHWTSLTAHVEICRIAGIPSNCCLPVMPTTHAIQARWVRDMYVHDARARQERVTEELDSETGSEILSFDWTVDAAKRCGSPYLFNVMSSDRMILLSMLTLSLIHI